LRPVAVHDAHIPAVERQVDDRPEALAGVAKLVVDGGALAAGRERIPTERDDGHATRRIRRTPGHRITRVATAATHPARRMHARMPRNPRARSRAASLRTGLARAT